MQYARAVDGIIVELQPEHPDGHPFAECFPPETAALFQEVADDVAIGDPMPANVETISQPAEGAAPA